MSFSSDPALLANQLPVSVEFPKEEESFYQVLTLLYKRIAASVNSKEGALYNLKEGATFQQYFTAGQPNVFRPTYRTVVNFGALPNTATKSVAHGIAFGATFAATRIYATATDPVNLIYLPIPYASAATSIELNVDAVNVNITTTTNRTAFTICYVVIEYTKTN